MISFQLWNIDIGINKFLDCTAHPNKWQEKRERRGWYSDLFLLQYSYFWGWTPSFPLTEMHTCCVFWIYSFATTISTTTGLGPPVASHPPRLSPLLSYQFSHEGKQQQQKQNMQKKSVTLLDLIPILTLTSKPSLGPRAQPERSEAWSGRPDVTNMSSLWRSKTRSGSQRDRSTGTLTHTSKP